MLAWTLARFVAPAWALWGLIRGGPTEKQALSANLGRIALAAAFYAYVITLYAPDLRASSARVAVPKPCTYVLPRMQASCP